MSRPHRRYWSARLLPWRYLCRLSCLLRAIAALQFLALRLPKAMYEALYGDGASNIF
jgi:hypothetical protein